MRYSHQVRRVRDAPVRPADGDDLVLDGLPQYLEDAVTELGELVQKEHSAVAERDLARPGDAAAADQARLRDGVVRSTERPRGDERRVARKLAGHAVHLRRLQRLVRGQRRHDGGERPREQRLAAAGWADHQDVVTAGGGDFQRALGVLLPTDVDEIGCVLAGLAEGGRRLRPRRDALAAAQVLDELAERGSAQHIKAGHQARLGGVRLRDGDRRQPLGARQPHHRQHAVGVPELPLKRQLPQQRRVFQGRIELSAAAEDGDGDGQVV